MIVKVEIFVPGQLPEGGLPFREVESRADRLAAEEAYQRDRADRAEAERDALAADLADAMRRLDAMVPGIVHCKDCRFSRIERHTGDARLTCWVRETHGEVVDSRHFCGKGKFKDNVSTTVERSGDEISGL